MLFRLLHSINQLLTFEKCSDVTAPPNIAGKAERQIKTDQGGYVLK